jgi:hypothetical protein
MLGSRRVGLPLAIAVTALLAGCGEAAQPNPARTVTVKLPRAKPAAAQPGFTGAIQPRG